MEWWKMEEVKQALEIEMFAGDFLVKMTHVLEMISEQEMLFGDLTVEAIVVLLVVRIVPKQGAIFPTCNVRECLVSMESIRNVPR